VKLPFGIGKGQGTGDVVILIGQTEIRELPVLKETEEAIEVEGMILPRADAEVRYWPSGGRAFVYGYTGPYLAESEHLKELERNTVLKSLFSYAQPQTNLLNYVLLGVLVLTIILLR
jgi:hypothetical protein